jgi:hypothetical protein
MFVIVVLSLSDRVEDVIGPFWDEAAAEAFARRNVSRYGVRYSIRPMMERGLWLAEMKSREGM